jgi:lipopolysaccharide transport system permease protein
LQSGIRRDLGALRIKTMTNNPQMIIRPSPKVSFLNAREIWRYRELLYMLAAREIQLRHKQTAFG